MAVRAGRPLAGASRGDPYSPVTASGVARHLFDALERRYDSAGRVNAELRPWQRALVAAATFHPSASRWRERFYRNPLAHALQSGNAAHALRELDGEHPLVVQVYALFQTRGAPYVIYTDNTHALTRAHWPAWSPFGERGAARWLAREGRVYAEARHVFVTGSNVAESLRRDYGLDEERVSAVGGGANFDPLPQVERRPGGDPVILFVGRRYAGFRLKGLDVLIEAFRAVRERLPSARLKIVGTDEAPAEPGIEVVGTVKDRARMSELYAGASVFCLPSRFEAYGFSLSEAMAHGVPCVASRVGSLAEVVLDGETGLIVPPGDADALAAALLRLLEDTAYSERLGAAGRRRVEHFLNWDAVVGRMAPVLDRLARPI